MKIANREIDPSHPPYIVAEIGCNHGGSVMEGFRLINAAKSAGANAVKIQCYTADTITYRGDGDEFKIRKGPWKGQTLHELYKKAETPPEMVKILSEYANSIKIPLFASVFDFSGVDLVHYLGLPAIKIASFELVDTPLIQMAASTGLPMIISTGMGSSEEIVDAINAYNHGRPGEPNFALLHCISSYPASPQEANLSALGPLSALSGGHHVVGFSDHTLGFGTAVAAVAFGASIIEKHFIMDRSDGGPDSHFSMEPAEFAQLVKSCREAWQSIQPVLRPLHQVQAQNLTYRKSIYLVKDVSSGDSFSKDNCRILRPAYGLAPKFYPSVLAGVANRDLKAGTPLLASMVSTLS